MAQKLKNNLEKKIFIKTFGCQMNEYDSNRIYDLAKSINYKKTNELDKVDCYVLNTCHIREKATDKVDHDIGRVKKNFRGKKKPIVVVTGCVAQAEGDIILNREKYIDAVIGPQSFHKFNQIIKNIEKKSSQENLTGFDVKEKFDTLNHYKNSDSSVSSFLTIQEGCDKFCKFCVVPYTRGAEFSRSIDEIFAESKSLVDSGAREIILLGQNVNAFNYKNSKLSNLIKEISKINDLKRIRYTTSHPNDFSEDLILAHQKTNKLMPLIHLPVQSGSNKILKNMNRKHTIEKYLELTNRLIKINPRIKFSSDFIIGYPGETEKDFEETLKIIDEVKYINIFSFIFSPRPGTPASKMEVIDSKITKERLKIFQNKASELKIKYRKNLINTEVSVLFENRIKNSSKFFGRDEHFNSVVVESNEDLKGKIENIRVSKINKNTLFGELLKKTKKKDFAA